MLFSINFVQYNQIGNFQCTFLFKLLAVLRKSMTVSEFALIMRLPKVMPFMLKSSCCYFINFRKSWIAAIYWIIFKNERLRIINTEHNWYSYVNTVWNTVNIACILQTEIYAAYRITMAFRDKYPNRSKIVMTGQIL